MLPQSSRLGGHLKTGQSWTGQNRPVGEPPQARVLYRGRSRSSKPLVSVSVMPTRGYRDISPMIGAAFRVKGAIRYRGVDGSGRVPIAVQPVRQLRGPHR
jgi:hypothetical protein